MTQKSLLLELTNMIASNLKASAQETITSMKR
jgi:hypothetical protein